MRLIRSFLLAALALLVPALARGAIVHVTTTGGPAGNGSTNSPFDLVSGLSHLAAGDTLYLANGAYAWSEAANGTLTLRSGNLVEGGFDANWHKDLSAAATITVAPILHSFGGSGYHVGVDVADAAAFDVRDLTLDVLPGGATGTLNGRGISVYGVHLVNCSDYRFERVTVRAGAASGGLAGGGGSSGAAGAAGTAGVAGHTGTGTCSAGSAGGAGAGNAATAGVTGCSQVGRTGAKATTTTMGGSGGSGASGSNSSGASGGPGGVGGDRVNNGGHGAGGTGGTSGCQSATNGQAGVTGGSGPVGSSYSPGSRPAITAAQRDAYFIAASPAPSGGDGMGGAGGGGGGGGGATSGAICTSGVGAGGGGGGGGGQGGGGGGGGYGGGSSYAVYVVANDAGEFTCCTLTPGALGVGGSGGNGGAGGSGGSGGVGQPAGSGFGGSGAGGNGGAGGIGGRGSDGVNGESVALYAQSGTAPTVAGGANGDGDRWPDTCDNCPAVANDDQRDMNLDGIGDACQTLAAGEPESPPAFRLLGARPNPSRAITRIDYELATGTVVGLRVCDAQGRLVRTLVAGVEPAGRRLVHWDLRDQRGRRVRAGLYFCRLSAAGFEAVERIVVLE